MGEETRKAVTEACVAGLAQLKRQEQERQSARDREVRADFAEKVKAAIAARIDERADAGNLIALRAAQLAAIDELLKETP